ncbi:alpha/beta fold hydrolase [Siccirubricoccus deserti]
MALWNEDFVTAWQTATVADAVLRRQAAMRGCGSPSPARPAAPGRLRPGAGPAGVHPARAGRGLGEGVATGAAAAPPQHLCDAHAGARLCHHGRGAGFRPARAFGAAGAGGRPLGAGRARAAGARDPRPPLAEPEPAEIRGRYVGVPPWRIQIEQAGPEDGLDLLCLHTAGADGRQFHRLMADRRLTQHWRLTAFDLPWHGKSPPPSGEAPGAWFLDTERYVRIIMGVIAAAGLRRPVVLGASMSGEICLELALRHPESFRGIVACEASAHIEGRKVAWADHPQVNQAVFVPEWIEGLMAPQSPAPCAADVWWHYSQGGHATFARDIDFYSGEWDARDRVHRIDTARCPLWMLTGEYDYSCTAEHSAATAALIPGARFTMMPGIGHFLCREPAAVRRASGADPRRTQAG